jgi:SAM-dependent methyltransferase
MKKGYDSIIEKHYQDVADEHGLSPASTMADEITRQTETDAIVWFVGECIRKRNAEGISAPATILDVGCGNGFTLQVLLNRFNQQKFVGVEKSKSLRALAESRFVGIENVEIRSGDIREKSFLAQGSIDILVCQRVIINLLDREDQLLALNNIVRVVASPSTLHSGGYILFIEAFETPLNNLNNARSEFDLPPIPPPYHNLNLPDGFFERADLKPFVTDGDFPPQNFLSTHYYVSRVLYPFYNQNKPLKRNSEFVRFFSKALIPFVGDYSQIRLYMFEKD